MIGIVISLLTGCLTWFISWGFIKILFFPKNALTMGKYLWESPLYQMIKKLPIDNLIEQHKSNSFTTILPFIDANLDSFFKERLVQKLPMISMFIGEKTITQLKEVFIEELRQLFPDLIGQLSKSIQEDFLSTLSIKWAPILETVLIKATKKVRWISFFIGVIWGWVIYLFLMYQ